MKYLCIGSGSIGKRHMRNLISIGVKLGDITATDPRKDRRDEVIKMGIDNVFETLDQALASGRYDAALVCSPTNLHIEQGIKLANQGIHILMEKHGLKHGISGMRLEILQETK